MAKQKRKKSIKTLPPIILVATLPEKYQQLIERLDREEHPPVLSEKIVDQRQPKNQ